MPYTNPTWDPAVPADGDLLSQGDDVIRAEKLDTKERVESFFKSIDDDPWLPLDGSIPGTAIKSGTLLGAAFDPALNLKTLLLLSTTWSAAAPGVGSWTTLTFTVPGAEVGDLVFVQLVDTPGFFTTAAKVTATDTVSVAFYNLGPGTPTITASILYIMVVKPGVPGTLAANLVPITVPHTEFQPDVQTDTLTYTTIEVTPNTKVALTILAGVTIAVGTKLSTASITVRADNTATLTGHLYKINAGVTVDLWPFAATVGGGVQTLAPGAGIDYTVGAGDYFIFSVTMDTSASTNANDAAVRFAGVTLG